MLAADTNLFIHAADSESPHQGDAIRFFESAVGGDEEFVLCELVLVELYMQLRNHAVLRNPQSPREAAEYCARLKNETGWRHVDYDPAVSAKLWKWARETTSGFRDIIDARLALTLRHHGVTRFATANTKHFQNFGFTEVWNPLLP